MEYGFGLTPVEIIFLVMAVLFTVPLLLVFRWVIKELKKDQDAP